MSAVILAPVESLQAISATEKIPDLSVSVSVHADRQRLFQMLTVAEYLETWLVMPVTSPESRLSVTSAADSFRIDHFRSQQLDCSVMASYRTCRRGKLHFTWRKDTRHSSSTSEVTVRLCGDFENTTLALRHMRLGSSEERAWHRALWEQSLRRLSLLFGPGSAMC